MQNNETKEEELTEELKEKIIDQELDCLARILIEGFINKKLKENPWMRDPRPLREIKEFIRESKKRNKKKR
jgi:hypothetical protein